MAGPLDAKTLKRFRPDGSVLDSRQVHKDPAGAWIEHGLYRRFHPGGAPALEGRYHDGKAVGAWTAYDARGNRVAALRYRRGRRRGDAWCLDASGVRRDFTFSKSGKLKGLDKELRSGVEERLHSLGFP